MTFLKSSAPGGKKQTPIPGPNSSLYKKIVAAKKAGAAANEHASKNKKRPRTSSTYSSLKSRQRLVERIKREIWASVQKINESVINLALAGNFNAAKALFDFAGVYSLPEPEDTNANSAVLAAAAPQTVTAKGEPNPVDAFFHSIGVQSLSGEPEPATAGLVK